jgi:hypothetical protein
MLIQRIKVFYPDGDTSEFVDIAGTVYADNTYVLAKKYEEEGAKIEVTHGIFKEVLNVMEDM